MVLNGKNDITCILERLLYRYCAKGSIEVTRWMDIAEAFSIVPARPHLVIIGYGHGKEKVELQDS